MRHLTAVKLDEGWRYASVGDRGGHPLGYCGGHYHSTEADARECFAQFKRDHVTLDAEFNKWSSCGRCGAPTKRGAQFVNEFHTVAALCDEHTTRADAISALGIDQPAGDTWVF